MGDWRTGDGDGLAGDGSTGDDLAGEGELAMGTVDTKYLCVVLLLHSLYPHLQSLCPGC